MIRQFLRRARQWWLWLLLLPGAPLLAQGGTQTAPDHAVINAVVAGNAADPDSGGLPLTVYFVVLDENNRAMLQPPLIEDSAVILVGTQAFPATVSPYTGESYVTLLTDNTRSMSGHMPAILTAFLELFERKPANVLLALRTFGQESAVVQEFTPDATPLREESRGLTTTEETLSCPYDAARDAVNGATLGEVLQASPQVMRSVILLSDGVNNGRCDYNGDDDLGGLIELANEKRITFYTILFDANAREEQARLEKLARDTGGTSFLFTDPERLSDDLNQVVAGLNTQQQAQALVFTENEGELSVNLELRVRGQGNETTPLQSTSITGFRPPGVFRPKGKQLYLEDNVTYVPETRDVRVVLRGANMSDGDRVLLQLYDTEMGTVVPGSERTIVWQAEQTRREEILPTEGLVGGRQYTVRIFSEAVPLPPDAAPGAPLSERTYTHGEVAPPPAFRLSLRPPQPDSGQLELQLIGVVLPAEGRTTYRVTVTIDDTPVYPTTDLGEQVLSDTAAPLIVPFYPTEEASADRDAVEADITVWLTWPGDRESQATVSARLPLRPRAGWMEGLAGALGDNPLIPGIILIILGFALFYLLALRRMNRLNPAAAWRPVRSLTQTPPPPPLGDPPAAPEVALVPQSALPALPQHPPLAATLRVVRAPDAAREGEIVVINRFPFRIGREGCELTIGDGRTSRHHASIQQIGDQLVIIDKSSKNGTFLNDAPNPLTAGMRWPMQDGDHIRIGSTIELQLTTHPTGDAAPGGGKRTGP